MRKIQKEIKNGRSIEDVKGSRLRYERDKDGKQW